MQNYFKFISQLIKVNSSLGFLANTLEKPKNKEAEKFFSVINNLKDELLTLNDYFNDYKEASIQTLVLTKQVHQILNYYYEPLKEITPEYLTDKNNEKEIKKIMHKIRYVRDSNLMKISIGLPAELKIPSEKKEQSINVKKSFKLFKGLLNRDELLGILDMVNSNIDRISRYLTSKLNTSNPLAYLKGALKHFNKPTHNQILFLKDMGEKDYEKLRTVLPAIESALEKLKSSESGFKKFHELIVKHINIALVDLNRTTSSLSHKIMDLLPRSPQAKSETLLTEEDLETLHSILENEVKSTRKKKLKDTPIIELKVASLKFLTHAIK